MGIGFPFTKGKSGPRREADPPPHLVLRSRMSRRYNSSLLTSAWHGGTALLITEWYSVMSYAYCGFEVILHTFSLRNYQFFSRLYSQLSLFCFFLPLQLHSTPCVNFLVRLPLDLISPSSDLTHISTKSPSCCQPTSPINLLITTHSKPKSSLSNRAFLPLFLIFLLSYASFTSSFYVPILSF
jgi:hypothetical protein